MGWICGYANAQGGLLYIGINNDGKIIGLKDLKKLLEDIPNKIKSTLGIVCDVNCYEKNGLHYIEIVTPPVNQVITYQGRVHYRSGATKQILSGPSLMTFYFRKLGTSWDALTVDKLRVDELDDNSFRRFKELGIQSKRLTRDDLNLSNFELLQKLDLIKDGKLTYAAMLLFYNKPSRFVPDAFIKVGYFTSESNLIYHDIVSGSLVQQADKIIDLIYLKYLKYLKGIVSYKEGLYRVETYQYPRDVIREGVFNSMIHNLYQAGNSIDIKVYPDKLVIYNLCSFYEE